MILNLKIDSILGGHSATQYVTQQGQFLQSIGIDPDLPISDSVGDRLASGMIRPSGYAKFSSSNITSDVVAIITTPKTALIYVVQSNGKLVSYDSAFGTETLLGTCAGNNCSGAFYYDNYIYMTGTGASKNDVSRWGALDGTAALTDAVWTGSTLGSQTALVNTTYPSYRGSGVIPNHYGFVHVDGNAYFLDFDSTSSTATRRGRGLVHKISTKYTSAQGDTNNNSAYNVLDLPPDYMPTCGCSYGNDIVIGAIQTNNSTLTQGKACLFFWDTVSSSFYNVVELPDSLVTALSMNNGVLHVFTGSVSNGTDVSNGYRVSVYVGGQSLKQLYYSDVGAPPLQGAVESMGNRVSWGTFTQVRTTTAASPTYHAVVMSMNSKNAAVPNGVQCIARATATADATNGFVTAIKCVQQSSFSYPKYAIAWKGASSTYGIDSQSTTYGTAVFRSQKFPINHKGALKSIRLNFATPIAANITITPKIFTDDFSSSTTLTVINNTNFPNSERSVLLSQEVAFDHNFVIELAWSGTALCPVLVPIELEVEVRTD